MKMPTPWLLAAMTCLGTVHQTAGAEEARPHSAQVTENVQTLPARLSLGFERVKLPADEKMGLLGGSYVFELSPGWWLGPAVYGAASGRRGGLFTWGAEGQRRWRLAERWELTTGMYVGGGGGASAPVGGGLMLRPHADLMFDFGRWSTGLTVSHVRFPSGSIRSTQVGWQVAVNDGFAFMAPGHGGSTVKFDGVGGLGVDRISLVGGHYGSSSGYSSSLSHVGVRLEWVLDPVWSATAEAHGAASGGADGYAEMTGGALALWSLPGDVVSLGGHAVLGLAGGGAVPTGGGTIAKLGVAGRLHLGRQFTLDAEAGRARSFGGGLDANYAQLSLGMALGTPRNGAAPAAERTVQDMEWELSLQDYLGAERKVGPSRNLGAIGLKFRRSLDPNFYLTGQAFSAITGGAGAYSAGLVGLGATARLGGGQAAWKWGAEALVGAAGGGGVASRGGAIVQPMAWIGRDLDRHNRIKLGAGYIKSIRGDLSSPVLDLTWAMAFGAP